MSVGSNCALVLLLCLETGDAITLYQLHLPG